MVGGVPLTERQHHLGSCLRVQVALTEEAAHDSRVEASIDHVRSVTREEPLDGGAHLVDFGNRDSLASEGPGEIRKLDGFVLADVGLQSADLELVLLGSERTVVHHNEQ